MSRCISQVTLFRNGGLPRDHITNTMHWEDDSGASSNGGISVNGPGLITRIRAFYNSVGQIVFPGTLTGQMRIRLYDADDPVTRVPRLENTGTVTRQISQSAMPGEVAICLSFKAEPLPGVIAARRRGRIFLGPCAVNVLGIDADAADASIPYQPVRLPILNAAKTLATGGPGAFRLAVYSPTTTPTGAASDPASHDDASYNDVTDFWIDNAFDTMRKRGQAPTKRATVRVAGSDPVAGS